MERLIVVVGQTGVGKSSFICDLVPGSTKVGQGLKRETVKAQSVGWTSGHGIKVILVDTPGFDAAREADEENLGTIATHLQTQHRSQTPQLCGLVYVHMSTDIHDIQAEAAFRRIGLFHQSCGLHSMKHVAIITTMWDKVASQIRERREIELETLFKPLLDKGAVIRCHDKISAAAIIDHLLKEHATPQSAHEFENNILPEETAAKYKVPIKAGDEKSVNWDRIPWQVDKEDHRRTRDLSRFPTIVFVKTDTEIVRRVAPHSDSTLSKPSSKCVMDCVELVTYLNLSKSTLGSPHSALSRHIVNRIFKFVLSLDINVQHMEDQRKTCEPILDSKSLRELQDFLMKSEFSLLLSNTQRLWSGAQNHIRMGISEIKANLDAPQSRLSFEWLFGNRQAKLDTLSNISNLLVKIAAGMEAVMEWWSPVFDVMGRLRREVSCTTGESLLEKDMISLRSICTAMNLYYNAYETPVKEMLHVHGISNEQPRADEKPVAKRSKGTVNKF